MGLLIEIVRDIYMHVEENGRGKKMASVSYSTSSLLGGKLINVASWKIGSLKQLPDKPAICHQMVLLVSNVAPFPLHQHN